MVCDLISIKPGKYTRGLSVGEIQEAKLLNPDPRIWWESVPPIEVQVEAFSISRSPISALQVSQTVPALASKVRAQPPDQPARLNREDAIAAAIAMGGRLPTEEQWEYAIRGGTKGLFPFGKLGSETDLEEWMSWSVTSQRLNGFGLRTLFTGEWCSDNWRLNPSHPFEPNIGVVRGGAAYFWPWQDEEWVWAVSAARSPTSELPELEWSFRLLID